MSLVAYSLTNWSMNAVSCSEGGGPEGISETNGLDGGIDKEEEEEGKKEEERGLPRGMALACVPNARPEEDVDVEVDDWVSVWLRMVERRRGVFDGVGWGFPKLTFKGAPLKSV